MKEFKGRVIAKGHFVGEAAVTHTGFNTLASFQKSALMNKKEVYVSDQNNKELFNKNITGKILCLPINSLAASGIVLAKVWQNSDVICIDKLGKEFLDTVKTGNRIEIKEDGTVVIL